MMTSRTGNDARRRRGFTLIELLLVVVIGGLLAGLAMPRFAQGFRAARLRAAARQVTAVHRYARQQAVLRQQDYVVFFDTDHATLSVVALDDERSAGDARFIEESMARGARDEFVLREEEPEWNQNPVSLQEVIVRQLEKVRISHVESAAETQQEEGVYWIIYQPNGLCDAFTLRLEDDENRSMKIVVDPISGLPEVTRE